MPNKLTKIQRRNTTIILVVAAIVLYLAYTYLKPAVNEIMELLPIGNKTTMHTMIKQAKSIEDARDLSTLVAVVKVKSIEPNLYDEGEVYSKVKIEIVEVLKGENSMKGKTIETYDFGGEYRGKTHIYTNTSHFVLDEEAIAFIDEDFYNAVSGEPWGVMHKDISTGKYVSYDHKLYTSDDIKKIVTANLIQ